MPDLFRYIPYFLPAAWMTLVITSFGILIGLLIGFPISLARLSKNKAAELAAKAYIGFIRGTPLLLQLFFIYFGLVRLIRLDPLPSAALALGIHNGAYIAEIFRGAIQSVDKGQIEAGRALGMSKAQTLRRIILPQAFRRALPPLGNQFIIALKDSSLASTISIRELVLTSRQLASSNYMMMEMLMLAAVFYLIMTGALSFIVHRIEYKMSVGERAV
ncbi:MAG: amino acid ABC transporter permease [Spirochaetes bacterium]|nr:amino acid ABC transporter permease [Spirochaetota bacterium]MBU0955299.1 amino acid ABC transporter permease [Spirochaetota bacterium]